MITYIIVCLLWSAGYCSYSQAYVIPFRESRQWVRWLVFVWSVIFAPVMIIEFFIKMYKACRI